MTLDEKASCEAAITCLRSYGAKPQKVLNKRMAMAMNREDRRIGITRPRFWAMGDQFVIVVLPEGPRVVMFV